MVKKISILISIYFPLINLCFPTPSPFPKENAEFHIGLLHYVK
jgi:hypothetical protein